MAIVSRVECSAMGCHIAPNKGAGAGLFCKPHWLKIPETLRGPGSVKQAIVHLAVEDGYLVKASAVKRTPIREQGTGRGYV